MSITKSQIVENLRNQDSNYYKGHSDEEIFQATLQKNPELLNILKLETTGQQLYKKIGSAASAGFGKRFMHQFETQQREMGAGLAGMMPWNSTKAAEDRRKYVENIYKRKIADDVELQALLAWKEDEPGWTNLNTAVRSLSEALPSLSLAIVSTGVGVAASAATGGSSLAITTASLAPMFAMEAGTEYVEAMRTMVDEMGMDAEEARGYAQVAAGTYGVVSTLLERVGAKQYLKLVPGLNVKTVEGELLKKFTKSIVKSGANKNFIVRQGARALAGTAQTLSGAMQEGTTEWMQSVTQQTINLGLKHGLGEDGVGVLRAMQQNFKKASTSKEALEEGFAGATTGILGFGKGYTTSVSKSVTSEDIAAMESVPPSVPPSEKADYSKMVIKELKPLLKERGLSHKGKKADLVARLEQNDAVKEVTTKDVLVEDTSLFGRFLSAVINPSEKMGDIVEEVKGVKTPLEEAIKGVEGVSNTGKKLLQLIKGKPELVDSIVEHEESKQLFTFLHSALEEASGQKIAIEDITQHVKAFAIKGNITTPSSDVVTDELGAVQDIEPVVTYDPSMIEDIIETESPVTPEPKDGPIDNDIPLPSEPGMPGVTLQGGVSVKGGQPPLSVYDDEQGVSKKGTRPKPIHSIGNIIQVNDNVDLAQVSDKNVAKGLKKGGKYKVVKVTPKMYKVQEVDSDGDTFGPIKQIFQNAKVAGKWTNKHLIESKEPTVDYNTYSNTQLNKKIKELGIEANVPKTKTGKISFAKNNKEEIIRQIEIAESAKISIKQTAQEEVAPAMQESVAEEIEPQMAEPPIAEEEVPEKILAIKTKKGEKIEVTPTAPATKDNIKDFDDTVVTVANSEEELAALESGETPAKETLVFIGDKPHLQDEDGVTEEISIDRAVKLVNATAVKEKAPAEVTPTALKISKIVKKIISGGQIGADIFGLEVGQELGIETGGTAPPKFQTSDGKQPEKLKGYGLVAGAKDPKVYRKRTIKNVKDADGTVIFGDLDSSGSKLTVNSAKANKKPYITNPTAKQLKAWIKENNINTLNVAGNRNIHAAEVKPILKEALSEEPLAVAKEVTTESIETEDKASLSDYGAPSNETDMLENFQDEGSSEEQLISHNKKLAEKILNRLKKHFPFIDIKTFEGLINVHGVNRIGFAMEKLVAWSTTDGRLDTMPHEFAHIYIKMLRNEPIIKLGIKQFESEEALVKQIGLYYTDRIQEKSIIKRIKIWLKQFANKLRLRFGKLDKIAEEDLGQIIAEEFYQGRWLGVEVAVGEQFLEFANDKEVDTEETERSDEQIFNQLSKIPNDIQITSFLSNTLGIYIDSKLDYPHIIDIAKESKTFEEYRASLFTWAKSIVESRARENDKLKSYTDLIKEPLSKDEIAALSVKERKAYKKAQARRDRINSQLRNDWLKALVRIRRFSRNNPSRQGKDTRVYQEWIVTGKGETGILIADDYNKITGKKAPETNTMNFIEEQFIKEESENRLFFLPVKEIMHERVNGKTKEVFHVSAVMDFSKSVINTAQKDKVERYIAIIGKYLGSIQVESQAKAKKINNSKKSKPQKMKLLQVLRDETRMQLIDVSKKSNLLSIIGSKMGDYSAIISTKTAKSDLPTNITPDSFVRFIDNEVENGNMTEEHQETIFKETRMDKISISKNPLITNTLEEYINNNPNMGTFELMNNIINYGNTALKAKAQMSQMLSRYKFWQEARVKDYLMYENSASDSMTRLSIDFAEGPHPKGAGKAKLMLIDGDVKAMVSVDGKEISAGNYDGFDGATFTGTRYLSKIAKAFGYKQLHQIKTFIRQRDNDTDYIGMKHMQFNPYKGMRFYRGDTLIAEVRGSGADTYFVDMRPDSPTYEQKFDMIASPNEAKMSYGKYSKDNDGFYKLHDIAENSIKVTQVKDKTKTTASHPIALGELLLAIQDTDGNAQDLIKQIRKRYGVVVAHYMEQLNSFYENPKLLKDFVSRVRAEENIPTELEEYIDLIGDDGRGLFHPVIISHLLPILNSRIFKEGIFKARGWENKASDVYLKPAAHLQIKDGNVMVSSNNTVAVNQVESAYIKDKGEQSWANEHDKIKALNEWLEAGNNVKILIHRNPIAKVTGPVLRNIQRLVEGQHGQTIMLSTKDVIDILDGDWDGDKAVFEFIGKDYVEALENWQESSTYKDVDKIVSLAPFGKRTDKDDTLSNTSVSSWDDVATTVSNNAITDGATGVMVNARTVLSQLSYKKFKVFIESLEDSNGYIEIADPNTEVVMDYIEVDETQLDKRELSVIENNGDSIVEIDGKKYLKTTKQHELAILFQMAVDAVKYRFWGEIVAESKLSNFEFMLTRIFNRSDGKTLTKAQLKLAGVMFSAQNISKIRAGRTKENMAASFDQNVNNSLRLAELVYDLDTGKKKSNVAYNKAFMEFAGENAKGEMDVPLKVEMENNISPAEELLLGIGKNIHTSPFYYITTNRHARNTSHVLAMNALMKSATGTKLYAQFMVGDKQSEFQQVQDFLYKKDNDGNNFVSIWKSLLEKTERIKDIRMDLNQDFVNFVDKYIGEWESMSNHAQSWATIEMLSGFNNDINIMKLPPLKLMNKDVIKRYLPLFESYLREQSSDLSESKTSQEVRQDSILNQYLKAQEQVVAKYEQADEKVGVCN
jgi:hypothetical protein